LDSNTEVFKSKGFDIPLCIPTSLQDKHSDSYCQHWIHSDHCKDKSVSANTVVFWDHQSCLLQDCSKRGKYSYYRYWWSQLLISLYLKCIFVFLPFTALSHCVKACVKGVVQVVAQGQDEDVHDCCMLTRLQCVNHGQSVHSRF